MKIGNVMHRDVEIIGPKDEEIGCRRVAGR
jgi:hypothetical protein